MNDGACIGACRPPASGRRRRCPHRRRREDEAVDGGRAGHTHERGVVAARSSQTDCPFLAPALCCSWRPTTPRVVSSPPTPTPTTHHATQLNPTTPPYHLPTSVRPQVIVGAVVGSCFASGLLYVGIGRTGAFSFSILGGWVGVRVSPQTRLWVCFVPPLSFPRPKHPRGPPHDSAYTHVCTCACVRSME